MSGSTRNWVFSLDLQRDAIYENNLKLRVPYLRPIRQALGWRESTKRGTANIPRFLSDAVTEMYSKIRELALTLPIDSDRLIREEWNNVTEPPLRAALTELLATYGDRIWGTPLAQRYLATNPNSPLLLATEDEGPSTDLFMHNPAHYCFILLQLEHIAYVMALQKYSNVQQKRERQKAQLTGHGEFTSKPIKTKTRRVSQRAGSEDEFSGEPTHLPTAKRRALPEKDTGAAQLRKQKCRQKIQRHWPINWEDQLRTEHKLPFAEDLSRYLLTELGVAAEKYDIQAFAAALQAVLQHPNQTTIKGQHNVQVSDLKKLPRLAQAATDNWDVNNQFDIFRSPTVDSDLSEPPTSADERQEEGLRHGEESLDCESRRQDGCGDDEQWLGNDEDDGDYSDEENYTDQEDDAHNDKDAGENSVSRESTVPRKKRKAAYWIKRRAEQAATNGGKLTHGAVVRGQQPPLQLGTRWHGKDGREEELVRRLGERMRAHYSAQDEDNRETEDNDEAVVSPMAPDSPGSQDATGRSRGNTEYHDPEQVRENDNSGIFPGNKEMIIEDETRDSVLGDEEMGDGEDQTWESGLGNQETDHGAEKPYDEAPLEHEDLEDLQDELLVLVDAEHYNAKDPDAKALPARKLWEIFDRMNAHLDAIWSWDNIRIRADAQKAGIDYDLIDNYRKAWEMWRHNARNLGTVMEYHPFERRSRPQLSDNEWIAKLGAELGDEQEGKTLFFALVRDFAHIRTWLRKEGYGNEAKVREMAHCVTEAFVLATRRKYHTMFKDAVEASLQRLLTFKLDPIPPEC